MSFAWLLIMLAAYLLGSLPSGLLVCRIKGAPDPRSGGSGNLGATNVARMAGKPAGIITLILDMAKGALPVWLALGLDQPWQAGLVGLAAFCGHIWPIYLGFKGGKGVATALGIILAFSPAVLAMVLGVFVLVYLPFKYVSLSSMCALCSAPFWLALWGAPAAFILCSVLMAGLIIWRHKENITRLRQGREHHLSI